MQENYGMNEKPKLSSLIKSNIQKRFQIHVAKFNEDFTEKSKTRLATDTGNIFIYFAVLP